MHDNPTPTFNSNATVVVPTKSSSLIGHLDSREVAILAHTHGRIRPRPSDRVIIPACNEEVGIERTLRYLTTTAGFKPGQIVVMVNNSDDQTEAVARKFCGVHVYEQRSTLSHIYETLEQVGFNHPNDVSGKGSAMFAASLTLEWSDRNLCDNARIFFLDADIMNVDTIEPIHHLLWGWKQFPDVRMVKLAAQGRRNEGIHAFLGIPGNPFMNLGCFQWPLCGQMSVLWGDLKEMRLTTGYSVEVVMMADLLKRYASIPLFAEVDFGMKLCDKWNNEAVHVRMYRTILGVLDALRMKNCISTRDLSDTEVLGFNQNARAIHRFWVPSPEKQPTKQNLLESHQLDAILPSVAECH